MKVRYGKPIKVKNILNSFNTVGTGNEYGHMTANKEGYFYHNTNVSNLRKFGIINGHKYFLCANTEFALDSFVIMSGATWYQALFTSPTPTYSDGNSYAIMNNINTDNDNVGMLVWCKNHNTWKVYNCIIIDLTEIGLDTLTAQEFYNKYNKYFSRIATGEEITIDDKAGQIAYKNLEENSIRCKVAGGQSDTYYNYNQQITHNNFDEQADWRVYMQSRSNLAVSNNKAVVTSVESGGWAYEYGLAKRSLPKPIQINHKYFVSAKVTTSYNTRVKFEINSNEGIFDDFVANTPKLIEGIVTTPIWYENAILIFPTSGFDPGKWFSVENVNVFDLTDWYGANKEPTTVAEIRNKFTKDYYDFSIDGIRMTRYQIENNMGHN